MERWVGKCAVVTGAAGGIGSAVASSLAYAGLTVVGLDQNVPDEKCEPQVLGCGSLQLKRCDLTNLTEVAAIFKWVDDSLGGTDTLINCAGYSKQGHITAVCHNALNDEDIAKILDVNLKAAVFCTRHAVASMVRRGFDGHIVIINSIAGHYVSFTENFNVYSSSKYGVTGFVGSLANELGAFGSKIKTTSISPGLVKTSLSATFIAEFAAVPSLQPSDIADAVLYVLSTPPHVNITELTIQPVAERRL